MGSVNLDYLSKKTTGSVDYVWSDIHLDLDNDYKVKGNFASGSTKLVDVEISYDVDAIFNSLFGLFNTLPGQRLLLPEYGLDIRQFLFRPVTPEMAQVIGETIKDGVEKWETRVIVDGVTVRPIADEHTYVIAIELYIPTLKRTEVFTGNFIRGRGFTRG